MPSPTVTSPQVAVNDIGSSEDFLAAIDKTIKYFNDGDIVEGTIVKVDRDEVLLDIGYKTEGVIPARELSIKHDVDPSEVVSVGDEVEALVLTKEDKEGRLILSKKRAQYERAWGTIEALKEKDEAVKGTVIEVVKGGLILDIGLRGFLPASLVEMRRVRDLQPYIGKEIEAKIIELDKNRNNVVLSRRAWLEQTQSEVRSEFLNQLHKGAVRKGVVSSIVNFGAFVDLGGVDGLVHVSELSWKHIDHPSEVVQVGDEVTVEVLDVDMDRERVSCRSRRLRKTRGATSRALTPSARSCRARSPSWFRSAPSSASRRASRVWCTSRSWPSGTSRCPTRWSPSATTRWSRSSTSTWSAAGFRCRSSRPTRITPRSSTRRSTAWPTATTSGATTSSPRASTPRPTSGWKASIPSAASGRPATPRPSAGTRCTPRRWRSSPRPTRTRPAGRERRRPITGPTVAVPRKQGEPVGRWGGQRRPIGCHSPGEARRSQRLTCGSRMLRIGLTGGIGAGKSALSATFAKCGAVIVDGDVIAREVVEPGTEGLASPRRSVRSRHPAARRVAQPSRVGGRGFPGRRDAEELNGIVHPLVGKRREEIIAAVAGGDGRSSKTFRYSSNPRWRRCSRW